jgi:hypothetical protein
MLISIVVILVHTPSNSVWGFLSLPPWASLPAFVVCFLDEGQYLLTICTSFENCLFNSFAYLLIKLFVLFVFNFFNYLYILDINPLPIEQLGKIFFYSVGHLLILIIVSFAGQKLFNLIQFHLSILALITWAIGVLFKK